MRAWERLYTVACGAQDRLNSCMYPLHVYGELVHRRAPGWCTEDRAVHVPRVV